MKSLKYLYLPLLLPLLSGSGLFGQTSESDIQLRFRALALNYPVTSGIYLKPEGGKPLRIYSNSRTDWMNYSGPNPITFYAEMKKEGAPSVRVPVGTFDAAQAPDSPLLIFSKTNADDRAYRINAVNDSVQDAPAGSYRLFNFTEKQIAGMIDDQRFFLSPQSTAYAKVQNPKDFEVTVQLAESEGGQAKRLYASSWTFSENFRYLVFILPSDDRTRGNINIRLIPDLIANADT